MPPVMVTVGVEVRQNISYVYGACVHKYLLFATAVSESPSLLGLCSAGSEWKKKTKEHKVKHTKYKKNYVLSLSC